MAKAQDLRPHHQVLDNVIFIALEARARRRRSMSAHSRVAKTLSLSPLSEPAPRDPKHGPTPASLHRRPKAIAVYRDPWSE